MSIYLDSCLWIYYYDHTGVFHIRAMNRLAQLAAVGGQIACSDLVRLECRVKPMQLGDAAKLATFDALFSRSDLRLIPLTTLVYDRETQTRARHGFKLGDSLHLAAAVEAGCDSFLTNDARLAAFCDINVEVLP